MSAEKEERPLWQEMAFNNIIFSKNAISKGFYKQPGTNEPAECI